MVTRNNALSEVTRLWLEHRHSFLIRESVVSRSRTAFLGVDQEPLDGSATQDSGAGREPPGVENVPDRRRAGGWRGWRRRRGIGWRVRELYWTNVLRILSRCKQGCERGARS